MSYKSDLSWVPVQPDRYVAQCEETEWLEDGDERNPDRRLLKGWFYVLGDDGKNYPVRFKMSPEEWRLDPGTKQPVKVTDENLEALLGWKPDAISRRWKDVSKALRTVGAIPEDATDQEVAEAITTCKLAYHLDLFETGKGVVDYVKSIDIP